VSPNCSRKSFIAKLGGLIAGAWAVPALFAKSGSAPANPAASPVEVRPDQRAIARKAGSF
jgi:hypothetical protein